jgi:hypothetical protein
MEVFAVSDDSWLADFITIGIYEAANPESKYLLNPKERKSGKDMVSKLGLKRLGVENDELSEETVDVSGFKKEKKRAQVMGELDYSYLEHYRKVIKNEFIQQKRNLILKALDIQPEDHLIFLKTNQTEHTYKVMNFELKASSSETTFLEDTLSSSLSKEELSKLGVLTWDEEYNDQIRKEKEELIELKSNSPSKYREIISNNCETFTISKVRVMPNDFSISLDMQIQGPFNIITFGQRDCSQFNGKKASSLIGKIIWDLILVLVSILTKLTVLSVFNYKNLYDLILVDKVRKDPLLVKIINFFDVFECTTGFQLFTEKQKYSSNLKIRKKLLKFFSISFYYLIFRNRTNRNTKRNGT